MPYDAVLVRACDARAIFASLEMTSLMIYHTYPTLHACLFVSLINLSVVRKNLSSIFCLLPIFCRDTIDTSVCLY